MESCLSKGWAAFILLAIVGATSETIHSFTGRLPCGYLRSPRGPHPRRSQPAPPRRETTRWRGGNHTQRAARCEAVPAQGGTVRLVGLPERLRANRRSPSTGRVAVTGRPALPQVGALRRLAASGAWGFPVGVAIVRDRTTGTIPARRRPPTGRPRGGVLGASAPTRAPKT